MLTCVASLLSRPNRLAGAAVLAVIGLATWNWYLEPSEAGRWGLVMVGLPAAWGAMSLYRWWALGVRAPHPHDEAVRRYADAAMRFFAVVIAVLGLTGAIALAFDVAESLWGLEGGPLEARVLGLMSGAIFVVIGNGLPKVLTPVSLLPDGGAVRMTRMRRFIGRSWVLIGLAIVATFAVVPLEVAEAARRWLLAAAAASIISGILWLNLWPDRRPA